MKPRSLPTEYASSEEAYRRIAETANELVRRASDAVTTANRPAAPATGDSVFDTTLGKPIWWNGSIWVLADGTAA